MTLAEEHLVWLWLGRCVTCGDGRDRHQGAATIGQYNEKDPRCSVVGGRCPAFRPPTCVADVEEIKRVRNNR